MHFSRILGCVTLGPNLESVVETTVESSQLGDWTNQCIVDNSQQKKTSFLHTCSLFSVLCMNILAIVLLFFAYFTLVPV